MSVARVLGLILIFIAAPVAAETVTVAVVDFEGAGAPELGAAGAAGLTDLIAAALSAREGVRLVERDALRHALDEQALGLSGVVDQATAARVRRLAGVQVLVTGRVLAVANRLIVTARLIATETGYVEAVAVEGRNDLPELARTLAERIGALLAQRGPALVAGARVTTDSGADLAQSVAGLALPRIQVHVRETVLDVEQQLSASASELSRLLLATNIDVRQAAATEAPLELDVYVSAPRAPVVDVDVIIFGTAVGRFGLRAGDLVSAKGIVKLTAVDAKSRRVLAVADAERKGIDVVPHEAAVQAITDATRASGGQLLSNLVRAWNRRDH